MLEFYRQILKIIICLKIFMKNMDYVMRIMASFMTLDELEGKRKRRNFSDSSGTNYMKRFIYWQPFGIYFRYIHQVYNHNKQINASIHLGRT